jgi:hypothetical protein
MVYFVAHVIYREGSWLPLSCVPVTALDLAHDSSPRGLSRHSHSLQLVYQPGAQVMPLAPSLIKTRWVTLFQRRFKGYLRERKRMTLPSFVLPRELGMRNATHVRRSSEA